MKDLSLLLLKNSFGAKMRKGFKNFCSDDGSTSTVHQGKPAVSNAGAEKSRFRRDVVDNVGGERRTTLEDMILKFEMEEEKAARISSSSSSSVKRGGPRRSAVDNTLLMSARDALSNYPRFSLDGKDAMYRSSFRNGGRAGAAAAAVPARRSVCCDYGVGRRMGAGAVAGATTFGGERVVWCKPGVVAKLMGLDALPVPINAAGAVDRRHRRDMLLLGPSRFHRHRHQ